MSEQPRASTNEVGENVVLGVLALGIGLSSAQWVVVHVLMWATSVNTVPVRGIGLLGLYLKADPSAVTRLPVPGLVHWVLVLVLVCVVGGSILAAVVAWRRWQDMPENKRGLATVTEVNKSMGARQLVRRADKLRPQLQEPRPFDVGYMLGVWRKASVFLACEESMVLIGPSRSGKGFGFVIPMCILAPGALVTTSTRPDNLDATFAYRARDNRPVVVFDPGKLTNERYAEHLLRFDLAAGCADSDTADKRAKMFAAANFGDVSNGGYWQQSAQNILKAMLHAAALGGKNIDEMMEWYTQRARARDAVEIIREQHGDGLVAAQLESVVNDSSQGGDTVWATAQNAVAYLMTQNVRRFLRCDDTHPGLDVENFIKNRGTLYLLGNKQSVEGIETLVSGLIEEFRSVGSRLAGENGFGRLEPPLWFICDEAANFAIKALPELISAGGGEGLPTVAVFQTRSQMETGIFKDGTGKTMWGSAAVRVVLGGTMDDTDAKAMETLIGTVREERRTTSDGRGGASHSWALEDRSIFRASEISQLPKGKAIVLRAGVKPFVLSVEGWPDRADIQKLKANI